MLNDDRRFGAREPLRQMSRKPVPSSRPRRAPTSRLVGRVSPDRAVPEGRNQIHARLLVPVGVGREATCALELITATREDIRDFNYVALDSPRNTDNFSDASMPSSISTEMDNEIHARRDSRHDESRRDVLAGQQGKSAHLQQSLPSRVRMEGAHSWNSTIKRDQ
jgi:hypothetical protein